MKAPKGKTNQPTRKISCWLAPYQEEWLRAEAARRYPEAAGVHAVIRSPVSRYLRALVEAAMEREGEPTPGEGPSPAPGM
jgi:hypothetical protein